MKVAVIGSGISGLGAAYLLSRAHDVEVFEREPRAGGHTHTVVQDGLALDTGFLVHNEQNYPLLVRLFRELGVRTQDSEMSFSVSCRDCGLEYSGRRPFAQPQRLADPRFHGLLWEIGGELRTEDGEERRFDEVVVATHADQALRLLEDPSDEERRVLGGFEYTRNDAVLHTDSSFLPRARSARASWNYRRDGDGRPTITYWLNRLQSLDTEMDYCVTLNEAVPEEHVVRRLVYEHPIYTVRTLRAQAELPALSGRRHTHYAGAHHGNGFHEDGLVSGVRAAAALGVGW